MTIPKYLPHEGERHAFGEYTAIITFPHDIETVVLEVRDGHETTTPIPATYTLAQKDTKFYYFKRTAYFDMMLKNMRKS